MESFVPVECSDQPLDFSFHPSRKNLVAAGLVDGTVEVHDISELQSDDDEADSLLSSSTIHATPVPTKEGKTRAGSCRSVLFSEACVYTGGSGGDLCALDAELVSTFSTNAPDPLLWRIEEASYQKYAPITIIREWSPHMLASGDEGGGLRIWDTRLMGKAPNARLPGGCLHSWKTHDDYISDVQVSSDGNTLLASSADCTLSVYDLRMASSSGDRSTFLRRSDDIEDELLSMQIMKNGRKVVCGTGEGILAVWSWGTWGDVSDRFPGHPSSVDAILKVDEDTLLTGSSDGLIRVVQIHPDKLLGVLGDHGGFPIEKLEFNSDRSYVGSITHDSILRLWDARILSDDYEGGELMDAEDEIDARDLPRAQNEETGDNSDEDWEDMDDDDEDGMEDASDEDESGDEDSDGDDRGDRFKTENERFFEDL